MAECILAGRMGPKGDTGPAGPQGPAGVGLKFYKGTSDTSSTATLRPNQFALFGPGRYDSSVVMGFNTGITVTTDTRSCPFYFVGDIE